MEVRAAAASAVSDASTGCQSERSQSRASLSDWRAASIGPKQLANISVRVGISVMSSPLAVVIGGYLWVPIDPSPPRLGPDSCSNAGSCFHDGFSFELAEDGASASSREFG
jgi:hypothetical protein